MLAFQSLVDATVSTSAVVHALFDQLADNGSALVLFDINRLSGLEPFIDPAAATLLSQLTDRSPRRYGRTLVTNADQQSLEVVERSIRAGEQAIESRPLGLAWPPEIFSLSHVALPFTPDDELLWPGRRAHRLAMWCGWAHSAREASARCSRCRWIP